MKKKPPPPPPPPKPPTPEPKPIQPGEVPPMLLARIKAMGPPIAPDLNELVLPELASKKKRFLIVFVLTGGNVARAAQFAGIAKRTHWKWLAADLKYKAAFLEAEEQAAQILEDEARRRAFEGTLKGVFFQGMLMDFELVYSDALMLQLLKARHKAHKPQLTVKGTGTGGAVAVESTIVPPESLAKLSEEQLLANLRILRDAEQYVLSHVDDPPPDPGIGGGDIPPPPQPDPGSIPGDGAVSP